MNAWWWTALAATFAILWKGTAKKVPPPSSPPKEEPVPRSDLPEAASPEMQGDELPDVSGHVEEVVESSNPFRGNGHLAQEDATLQETDQEVGDVEDAEDLGDEGGREGFA